MKKKNYLDLIIAISSGLTLGLAISIGGYLLAANYILNPYLEANKSINNAPIEIVVEASSNVNEEVYISNEEIELLALVTMAEAEGECEEGKRLVVDVILNRVDSEHFPNDIYGVVYQDYQFTSMFNGRAEKCVVTDEVRQLVKEELANRTNFEVLYFKTNDYHNFGTPMFQVGNHYFSTQ